MTRLPLYFDSRLGTERVRCTSPVTQWPRHDTTSATRAHTASPNSCS